MKKYENINEQNTLIKMNYVRIELKLIDYLNFWNKKSFSIKTIFDMENILEYLLIFQRIIR